MKRFSTELLIGLVCLVSTSIFAQQNYYWVGGTGSWTDLTHWATASGGGTKHTVVPTSLDDVFFDANSFSAGTGTVTITDGATCHNMNWTGVTNTPTIYAFVGDALNIYGSLTLPSTVQRDFMGFVHFKGTTAGNTVDLGGQPLRNPINEEIYFEGVGGVWTLLSKLETYRVSLTAGTLNTNGQQVAISLLTSTGSNAKALNLGASQIDCPTWDVGTATNLSVNAGSSTITTSFSFKGGGFTYNNLVVNGTSTITGNNTFATVTLNADAILNLTSGSTQTLTNNLVSNGTSTNLVTIKASTAGSAATLAKSGGGTVTINYAKIQDNTASPASTFTVNNGGDAGNNTNWTINPIEPSTQPAAMALSKVVLTSLTLNWTNGNGSKRLIVAKVGATVPATAPVDNTTYTAAPFGSGSTTAAGEYVVYSGTANTATITGLTAGTQYSFKVYEFNSGTGSLVNYLTASLATMTVTTLPSTAVVISNNPVSVCSGNYYATGGANGSTPLYYSNNESFTQTLSSSTAGSKIRLAFTSFSTSGSGDVLKIYDGADTSAPLIGSYSSSSSPGTVTATNSAGQLTLKWTSDANSVSTGWIATISCVVLDTEPTIGSSVTGGSVGGTSITLNFSGGNGTKRILVARKTGAVNFTPTDGNDYVANASFGSGSALNTDNFVVYNGSGNSATVSNLTTSTTYYFSLFEYNGANTSANYRSTAYTTSYITSSMASEPTQAATNISVTPTSSSALNITFTAGNGNNHVVVLKAGSPVDALPVDASYYSYTGDFTTTTDLGNGNKIVYSGSSANVGAYGLSPNTQYYVAVFEFNGNSAGITNYLTSSFATGSATTRAATPTTSATNISSPSRTFNAVKLSWTNGDGARRIVVATGPSSSSKTIVDGTAYTANSVFGQGTSVGPAGYVVYDGTGSEMELTGLQPGTTYGISIFEYNGTGTLISYKQTGSTTFFATYKYKPTVQTTNLTASNITSGSVDLSWTRGNGDYVVILAREGSPITQLPKDSTIVNDAFSTDFGAGTSVGNGIVIYKGNNKTSFQVTRLNPSTTYYFTAFEFNNVYTGNTSYNYFLTTNVATTSAQTVAGKDYFWVGGNGKWSEIKHWATTSNGSTLHTTIPSTSDNVYFDANSFTADTDTVLVDVAIAKCRNMDWTAVTKKASLIAANVTGSKCWTDLMVNGSLKLNSNMKIDIAEIVFTSTTTGNVIDLAGKTSTTNSCSSTFRFDGYGGGWKLSGIVRLYYLSMQQGTLDANNFLVDATNVEFSYGAGKKASIILGNSLLTAGTIRNGENGSIVGGTISLSKSTQTSLYANGASYRKVLMNGSLETVNQIFGGATIDSLVVNAGQQVILESGKTLKVSTLIFNGDSTSGAFIKATVPGSAATISKTSGTVNINYVFISDNIATGGAVFNANNSINKGNVTGWNFTTPPLFVPKKSASTITFYKVYQNQVKMKWKVGDGTARIVVVREGAAVDKQPVDGSTYSASGNFGTGANLGNNNFVVYNGAADSVVVNNLTAGKTYHVAIFEYNSWSNGTKYRRSNPAIGNIATLAASDLVISNTAYNVCNVRYYDEGGKGYYKNNKPFTQTLYPEGNSKLAVQFNVVNMFVLDTLIVYDGLNTSAPVLAKLVQTKPSSPIYAQNSAGVLTFRFKTHIFQYSGDYNGWEAEIFCVGTNLSTDPTVQASTVKITNETGTSMKVNFTKGNGTGRTIIARENAAVSKSLIDGVDFKTDAVFGNGTNLGDGNFVVYSGPDEAFDLTGLRSNTIYHFAAFEFNGTGITKNYLNTNPALGKDTTLYLAPTIASYNLAFTNITPNSISFSAYNGDGTGRILLMKKGGPVTAVPEDGKQYAAGTTMSDNSTVVASGSFFNGSVFQLDQLTTYYFKIYDYNGNSTRRVYLTTANATGSATTKGPTTKLSKLNSSYCPQTVLEAPFTITGNFDSGNKFSLQLSNESGSFDSPTVLKDSAIVGQNVAIRGLIPVTIAGGTYKVRVVSSSPVVTSDSVRTIVIPVVPMPTFTVADSTFTTTNINGNQWMRNGLDITGATGTSFRYKLGGVYTLKITQNGCSKVSAPYVVTGIEDVTGEDVVSLYPNPANNWLVVEPQSKGSFDFEVYSVRGVKAKSGSAFDKTEVNVSDFTPGIYLIRIAKGNKIITRTFVKQ